MSDFTHTHQPSDQMVTNTPANNISFFTLIARPSVVSDADKQLIDSAIALIQRDAKLNPEDKDKMINVVLGGSPNPSITAAAILSAVDTDGELGKFYLNIRRVTEYIQTGKYQATQVDTGHPDPGSSKSTSKVGRSTTFTKIKMRSPVKRCEVTAATDMPLHCCHIFPFAIGSNVHGQHSLWKLLSCFWEPTLVDKLKDRIVSTPKNINFFANGLVMTSTAHDIFDALDFYLEPDISTVVHGANSYTVVFHWTRDQGGIFNYWDPQGTNSDGDTLYSKMKSGTRIVLSSVDIERFPLPDPALLMVRTWLSKLSYPKANGIACALDMYDSDDQTCIQALLDSHESDSGSISTSNTLLSDPEDTGSKDRCGDGKMKMNKVDIVGSWMDNVLVSTDDFIR